MKCEQKCFVVVCLVTGLVVMLGKQAFAVMEDGSSLCHAVTITSESELQQYQVHFTDQSSCETYVRNKKEDVAELESDMGLLAQTKSFFCRQYPQ